MVKILQRPVWDLFNPLFSDGNRSFKYSMTICHAKQTRFCLLWFERNTEIVTLSGALNVTSYDTELALQSVD